MPLPDGSTAPLNSQSGAGPAILPSVSENWTLPEGQATFTVARDMARPVAIVSGNGETRGNLVRFSIPMSGGPRSGHVLAEGVVATSTDRDIPDAGSRSGRRPSILAARCAVRRGRSTATETAWRRAS